MSKKIISKRELLPTWVIFIPVILYGFYVGIKNKNLGFFTNINWWLSSEYENNKHFFMQALPDQYKPITILANKSKIIDKINMEFPCFVKPNNWCRWIWVKKIHNQNDLVEYHKKSLGDYVIQEFVPYDIELGVYIIKHPITKKTSILWIAYKEIATVQWDGQSTLEELIEKGERTKLFKKNFYERNKKIRNTVIPLWEKIIITDLWNHAQGAQCKDVSYLITEENTQVFDKIGNILWDIDFWRYDIKCKSFESFQRGEDIKILEFNGVKAEPLHLYDTIHWPIKAYKQWFLYIQKAMDISNAKRKQWKKTLKFKETIRAIYRQRKAL